MQQPVTVFDKPQAALLPDPIGPRFYANIDNRLDVGVGRGHVVAVAVPTELFTFLKEVANVPSELPVSLGITKDGDRYVFFMIAGDSLFDLWSYSRKSLPAWLLDRSYAIR
jgi:hypothetical protein